MLWMVLVVLLTLVALGWAGLQVPPTPFPKYQAITSPLETRGIPTNLPTPVQRFYTELYGQEAPIISSAVLTGRARMKLFGLEFPARFRFVHEAGRAYRHYFEVTFFGFAIFKVNEHFLDGQATLELPVGLQQGANIDQGANLALWAEAASFPALFITDARVRWQTLDDSSAVLIVPYKDQMQHFVVRFDQKTGLLTQLEAMRYRDPNDTEKHLWIAEAGGWTALQGQRLAALGRAIWLDQGRAWATFTTEEIVLNADVRQYVRANGI
jgi:hypothetical protein